MQFPEEAKEWHKNSNYLCQLSAKNEFELEKLARKAEERGIKFIRFYEPDLDNQLTAIALEPGLATKKLTQKLPLMLKEINEKKLANSLIV